MKNEHPNVMICPDSNEQMALSNNEKTKKSTLSEGSRFLKLVTTLIKIFQTTGVLPSAQQTEDIRFVFVKKWILNFYLHFQKICPKTQSAWNHIFTGNHFSRGRQP